MANHSTKTLSINEVILEHQKIIIPKNIEQTAFAAFTITKTLQNFQLFSYFVKSKNETRKMAVWWSLNLIFFDGFLCFILVNNNNNFFIVRVLFLWW